MKLKHFDSISSIRILKTGFRCSVVLIVLFFLKIHDLAGQDARQEIHPKFKKQWFKKSLYCTDEISIDQSISTPFIGLSAYLEKSQFDQVIFFRSRVDGKWSGWAVLEKMSEQSSNGRISFEGGALDQHTSHLQLKTSKPISSDLTVRLYFPGHSKKKVPPRP